MGAFNNRCCYVSIEKKQIGCHFCHGIILWKAGTIALQLSANSLQDYFASKSDANDYFIKEIVDSYIITTLHEFRTHRKKFRRLKRKVPAARRRWIAK